MTRIRSGKKNILSNAFFALLLMTILVSVAIILPRILLNNTISGIRTSIGFITIRYSYNKSNLEIEITNHYSAPITVINITIKNNTYLLSETITPENSTRIIIPFNTTSRILDVKITYIIGNQEKTVWKRLFIQNNT